MRRILGWLLTLAVLGGAGLGGWFVGSDVVATQPSAEELVIAESVVAGRRQVEIDPAAHPNTALVLGSSGLSPFGHTDGLLGRQVLTGRVVSISGGKLVLETVTGRSVLHLREDSTFLLRLERVDPSTIQAGAAVAVILDDDGELATAAIVLPAESRPMLNPGTQPVPPAGG